MQQFGQLLARCVEAEEMAADIYGRFAMMFPELEGFWLELERQERKHAYILQVAGALDRVGLTPDLQFPAIDDSLAQMRQLLQEMDGGMPLQKALEAVHAMESDIAEIYIEDSLMKGGPSSAMDKLRLLYQDTRNHSEMIEQQLRALQG